MAYRLSWTLLPSTLLPICVLLFATSSLSGQVSDEDPFGVLPLAKKETKQVEPTKVEKIPKVKEFEEKMKLVTSEYERMATTEAVLLETIEKLLSEIKLKKLGNGVGVDERVKETFQRFEERLRESQNEFSIARAENSSLKKAINKLVESESKAKATAAKALTQRNEMHQTLFASLLNSDDVTQQELAFTHLFACSDKYEAEVPINIYTPELLRRVGLLTEAESTTIRGLAARCLFTANPDSAIEMGIQFGPDWRPLEYVKSSEAAHRIYRSLNELCRFEYEESPLEEITETLQQAYQLPIRFEPGVDPTTLVTFKSEERPLDLTLAGLLEKYNLGFAIIDDEILVMKETNPKLLVTRTYNVRSLYSEKVELDNVIKMVEQSLDSSKVELTSLNDHVFVAKASEDNHVRIGKRLANVTPSPKWYSK